MLVEFSLSNEDGAIYVNPTHVTALRPESANVTVIHLADGTRYAVDCSLDGAANFLSMSDASKAISARR